MRTGKLLRTGNVVDLMDLSDGRQVRCSLVDAGNPAVFVLAAGIGFDGTESPSDAATDPRILQTTEEIRVQASILMKLAPSPAVPKVALLHRRVGLFARLPCYNDGVSNPSFTIPEQLKAAMPRRQSLFWEVDPGTIDPQQHSRYIIERIMDFGTDDEVRWMWQAYPKEELHRVATLSRGIDPRSKPLWTALTV